MSKIDFEITDQNYTIVRDQIIAILTSELIEQYNITSDPLFQLTIYKERFIPYDKIELPAISVYFSNSEYNDNNPSQSAGTAVFNIEVTTSAKNTSSVKGDTQAVIDCQKLIGVVRYILMNPNYLSLGLTDKKIIRNRRIDSINFGRNNQQDGIHTAFGIITLSVDMVESNGVLEGVSLEGYTTTLNENFKIEINK